MQFAGKRTSWRALVLVVVAIGGLAVTRQADAYRRRGHSSSNSANSAAIRARQQQAAVQAATAQLNAAKQVLAAAQSSGGAAQAKLDAALSKLRDEAQKFHDAQSTTRHLAKDLAEIEQEILEEQKDDSPYAKAGQHLEAARAKLKEVESQILAEPAVESQLSGLTGSKLDEKRASILGLRPEYLQFKALLEMAGSSWAHIRSELFQNDKDWKAAAEALTQARKDEKAAEEQTHGGTSGRVGTTAKIKNAAEAAAYARATIAQAEAVLRANGGSKYLNSPSSSKNPPPRKNK
jgi:chromosome segregation ATPase